MLPAFANLVTTKAGAKHELALSIAVIYPYAE